MPVTKTYTQDASPCCILDLRRARKNADAMLERCKRLGLTFRPHVKTHKTIEGALLQTGGRRSCIVVSTIAELAFFIDEGGFDDIQYAVPIAKNRVPLMTAKKKDVKIVVDHPSQLTMLEEMHARLISKTPSESKTKFKVVVMIGCGPPPGSAQSESQSMHQVGLDPDKPESIQLAVDVAKSPACTYEGVYLHAALSYNCQGEDDIKRAAQHECDSAAKFAQTLKKKFEITRLRNHR